MAAAGDQPPYHDGTGCPRSLGGVRQAACLWFQTHRLARLHRYAKRCGQAACFTTSLARLRSDDHLLHGSGLFGGFLDLHDERR